MSNTETSFATALNMAYTVFEPNQMLTSFHLNQLRIYLDGQDRLSRVKLMGIGIVCGLEASYADYAITISGGVGVTSEGFLINMEEESFKICSEDLYYDPKGYELFLDPTDEITGQIPLWELLPDKTDVSPVIKFETFDPGFLDDKVVVLFMEYKDVDLESCLGQNCDDKGISRQFTVRKLLIRCSDVDKFIRERYGVKFPYAPNDSLDASLNMRFYPDYAELPAFNLIPSTTHPLQIKEAYAKINTTLEIQNQYEEIFPNTLQNPIDKLTTQIEQAYKYYLPWLENVVPPGQVAGIQSTLKTVYLGNYKDKNEIQYFYDFAKDLFKAYNEFIDLAFEIVSECNPGDERFPRHLVLGKIKGKAGCPEVEDDCRPRVYRTHFIQSPIYNQQKDKIAKAQTYFRRMIRMINALQSKEYSPKDALKITPSDEKQQELAKRSIPFYYNIDPLYKVWNYDLTKRCKADWNKGYWSNYIPKAPQPTLEPLRFCLDPYNFYRIEGLLGKNVWEVCAELNDFKRLFHLDFEVETVKLRASSTKRLIEENRNHDCNDDGCCDDFIKDNYVQLRAEIIADVEKYNWVLTKLIYVIGNYQAIISEMNTGEKADYANLDETGAAAATNDPQNALMAALGKIKEVDKLIASLPLCIEQFNLKTFLKAFKDVQQMAFVVTALFEALLRANPIYGPYIQYFIERFLLANFGYLGSIYDLNDIVRSSADVRMQSLYHSYMLRLVANEKAQLFSNFAYNNPGLEHMAGVPKGGTFVMVYNGEDEKEGVGGAEDIVADFALASNVCCGVSVDMCGDNVEGYAPIAKNVYHFINGRQKEQKAVTIDVLEFSFDINVEEIDLIEFAEGTTSKRGGQVTMITSPIVGRSVVQYTPSPEYNSGMDEFEYRIVNAKTKKISTACVFIAILPAGQNLTLGNPAYGGSYYNPKTGGQTNTGEVYEGENETKVDWRKTTLEFGEVEAHEGMITDRDNSVNLLVNRTKDRYKKLRELDDLTENSTPTEKKERDKLIATELNVGLEETAELIEMYDKSLPKEEEMYSLEGIMKYNENRDLVSKRDAAVALYENQVKVTAEIAVSNDYTKDENSDVTKLINEKVRGQVSKIGARTIGVKRNFEKLSKIEGVDDKTRDLFGSFKINS